MYEEPASRRRGTRVRIVDFENFGESDVVYEDIASLVGYLRMLAHGPLYSRARLDAMRRAFLAAYGQRLLDVGCGTGRGLSDLSHTGARLVGSDASIDMLARAATVCANGAQPLLAAAHAQRLPLVDNCFDTVVSLNFLHLFSLDTQGQMVREMTRVEKPGGRLILEFDNALHRGVVGPWKRWTGRERGSLPREIRQVIGHDCRILRRRGAVYPVVWRLLARWPRFGASLERLGYLPGMRHLTHRLYYELQKPTSNPTVHLG